MNAQPFALIVEDNEDQNLVFTKSLEAAGYVTESVLDGTTALRRINETVPAIIILDLHLPGLNGRDLLAHIRSNHRLASTRVILATADAAMADSLQTQADLVLLKPISFSQLSMLAERYLLHPRGGVAED